MIQIYAVSFDPGKSTGVAEWNEKGEPTSLPQEISVTELDEYLKNLESKPPKKFIYEGWTLWKQRNKQFDKQITVQVIGQIKAWARRYGVELVENKPQDRLIAAKWSGTNVGKGHMPNWQSAWLHGYYHLHQIGLIPARVLQQ